jgi:hypothetical protein
MVVEVKQRTIIRGGAQYSPGEIASFPDDVAQDMITKGSAVPYRPQKKAVEAPQMHKMVTGSVTKGKQRA